MTSALRPMDLGEILDRAVQMLKSNFVLFAGIAMFPALATLAFSLANNSFQFEMKGYSLPAKFAVVGVGFVGWLGIVILSPLAAAAKCWAASRVLLDQPATIGSAYGMFKDRKGSLIGLGIMQGLLSCWPGIIAVIVALILLSAFHVSENSSIYGVVIFLGLVPCAPLYARYLLAYPAIAIENITVSDSLRRSVELGRGFRWKIFWAYALPVGIGMIVVGGCAAFLEWFGRMAHLQLLHPLLFAAIEALLTFVGSLFYQPLTSIALTLIYYDMCVRKEGFDIVQLIEQAEMGPATAATELA